MSPSSRGVLESLAGHLLLVCLGASCLLSNVSAQEPIELSKGEIMVSVGWAVDSVTREDVLRGNVVFVPNGRTPKCRAIKMIQAAKVLASPDVFDDVIWDETSGNYDRNFVRTFENEERDVTGGYFIDYFSNNCRKGGSCSPYFRDHFANAGESGDGVNDGRRTGSASIVDYPFGWNVIYSISLETCSVCVNEDGSSVLGCVKWGATWPLFSPRYVNGIEGSDGPSETFRAAYANFSGYYDTGRELR